MVEEDVDVEDQVERRAEAASYPLARRIPAAHDRAISCVLTM